MFKLTKCFGVEWAGVVSLWGVVAWGILAGLLWEWRGSWEAGRENKQVGNPLQTSAFWGGTQARISLLQAEGKMDMAPWGPLRQTCRQPTGQMRFLQRLPCLSGTWGLVLTPLCTRAGSASPSMCRTPGAPRSSVPVPGVAAGQVIHI